MKKKIYLLLTLSAALALLLTALPALSPVVFTSASEKGAIRHDIYKKGYPYQSYFAILRKEEGGGEAGLPPVFETGVKTPFKQPIADSLSVIGCLV
ncbi:hypothetical protein, partial [Bacillus velezensis]|uniref:hypothetical protein n=1 Tax=Bacillus velezensis TaxID=492670 RepID=UPI003F56DD55